MSKLLYTVCSDNDIEEEDILTLADLILQYAGSKTNLLITSTNIDWQHSSGYRVISLEDSSDNSMFYEIMPDHDFTFSLYEEEDGKLFAIVSSHDVPCGSTWMFYAIEDVEGVMDDIAYELGDGSKGTTLQDLEREMKDRLGLDITTWKKEDITHLYANRVLPGRMISLNDEAITAYLMEGNDNFCEVAGYCVEDIEKEYYKSIVNQ